MPPPIVREKRPQAAVTAETDPRPVLALLYAAMLGHLGIVMPFLAPWLASRGHDRLTIGLLLAVPPLCTVLAPFTWGAWADRGGRRRGLLLVALPATAAGLAGIVLFGSVLAALVPLVLLYGFARAPVLPFVEATSFEQADRRGFDYGSVRLWGSFAFVVASTAAGAAASLIGLGGGLLIAAGMLAVGAAAALAVARPTGAEPHLFALPGGVAATALRGAALVRFFVACALMQASHGAYYTFYSIRLEDLGYSAAAIGVLWALAVVCEILLLTRVDRIVARLGSVTVLRVSLALAVGRWLLIGSTAALPWLVVGQTLHAATYAAFHVAAVRIVHRSFAGDRRAAGQAMYSGMTFGLGLFVGSLVAGLLAAPLGLGPLFLVSALPALLALAILGRGH